MDDFGSAKVIATERYAYGWTDSRAFGPTLIGRRIEPVARPVPRTVVVIDETGTIRAKYPPIEQDWDHLTELLTIEEEKPDGRKE